MGAPNQRGAGGRASDPHGRRIGGESAAGRCHATGTACTPGSATRRRCPICPKDISFGHFLSQDPVTTLTSPPRQQVVRIARHPEGAPRAEDFRLDEDLVPRPSAGELRVRVDCLSIDPYLRALLGARYLTARPPVGAVVPGTGLCTVVESCDPGFAPGDLVVGDCGWREIAALPAAAVRRVDPGLAPPTTALGVLGIPGLTAWAGLRTIARPRAGETVLVSTAAGAVGSLAGQLARRDGARPVGIAGGPDKCRLAVTEFGYAACVDHRAEDLEAQLRAACPEGIDVYFDNVGGRVLEAAIGLLRKHARVVLCGLIDQYNAAQRPPGPNLGPVIGARATLTGLVVYDHLDRLPDFLAEVAPGVRDGSIRWREDVRRGLAAAPQAFVDLMRGANVGKLLVRVDGTPAAGRSG
jgi:NADPH-dependent curcumin reductase CurA